MSIKLHRKQSGAVATPRNIAEYLVSWAVRDPRDTVLDPGAGEGVFLSEVCKRLMLLGAERDTALAQVIGVEQDPILHHKALQAFELELGHAGPRLVNADLFDLDLPEVSVIVGNPPYVRRIHLDYLDKIRNRLTERNLFTPRLNGLTDLYIYFLIYASEYLKEGAG